MSKEAALILMNDRIKVSGILNFESVLDIWQESLNVFPSFTNLEIDLSGVTYSNSAGLALLLAWLRYATQYHMTICFKNLPQKMAQMASATGVEGLLKTV